MSSHCTPFLHIEGSAETNQEQTCELNMQKARKARAQNKAAPEFASDSYHLCVSRLLLRCCAAFVSAIISVQATLCLVGFQGRRDDETRVNSQARSPRCKQTTMPKPQYHP